MYMYCGDLVLVGIANGQILSIFDRVISLAHDRGWVGVGIIVAHFYFFEL